MSLEPSNPDAGLVAGKMGRLAAKGAPQPIACTAISSMDLKRQLLDLQRQRLDDER
jgi:hypothetical protein